MARSNHRILIVRPSALGDVCRSVPVLASLRQAFPDAVIDWVVQDTFIDAISAHPGLTGAIPFPRTRFARWWCRPSVTREMLGWFGDLRRRGYTLVFDCQGLGRSGLITRATGAPHRVGHRDARELAWLGYNVLCPPRRGAHAVDRMLDLLARQGVEPVPDLRLYTSLPDRQWWLDRRRSLDAGDQRYAVLAPTSRWRSKRWPMTRWRELLRPLLERSLDRLVVVGAPGEAGQVRGLWPDDPSVADRTVDLVGLTTVGQTMAVIAEADLVIANDSAALHMAVGFDRAGVGLFGPTEPAEVGPYGRPEAVVRRVTPGQAVNYRDPKIDDELMRSIEVEDVLDRVDTVLERARTTGLTPTVPRQVRRESIPECSP